MLVCQGKEGQPIIKVIEANESHSVEIVTQEKIHRFSLFENPIKYTLAGQAYIFINRVADMSGGIIYARINGPNSTFDIHFFDIAADADFKTETPLFAYDCTGL